MEIEAKFRIDDPAVFAELTTLGRIGPYGLQPEDRVEQQHNTYYDTADGRLRAARYGLRTREVDGRCVVTLKGPGEVRDGVHQRAEWEFESHNPAPATWPQGDARELALALLGDEPLLPLLTIHTHRRHIIAARDTRAIAELSLDEGTITAGDRTEGIRELEIELLPSGVRVDFDALVAALQEQFSLCPEGRSKLERGLALLDKTM